MFGSQLQEQQESGNNNNNNPTLEWKGVSHSDSVFTEHILIPPNARPEHIPTVFQAVVQAIEQRQERGGSLVEGTNVMDRVNTLMGMGAVWFLPAEAPRDSSQGERPIRLYTKDIEGMTLKPGDYVRVHADPRRFPEVYLHDWNAPYQTTAGPANQKPGVIMAEDESKGWLVINKPAAVPIHMTVDNCLENVQTRLQKARRKDEDNEDPYVGIVQRLDQNTSGLVTIATNKEFAAYFSNVLRTKTAQLGMGGGVGVHKVYKCLVCLVPPSTPAEPWSMAAAYEFLRNAKNETIRHWLEPSIRAPKRYVSELPSDWQAPANRAEATWLESLLKITYVGDPHALIGNAAGETLSQQLFDTAVPTACAAVVELEMELLTGRTHQIRGQMAAMGFPLVGDVQYGGALPLPYHQPLALQCSQLEFLDPDVVVKAPEPPPNPGYHKPKKPPPEAVVLYEPSTTRWNRFQLDRAWWTPYLEQYQTSLQESETAVTTSADDPALLSKSTSDRTTNKTSRPDLLPDRVQLSPGKNKYVLIRATAPSSPDDEDNNPQEEYWFVKSAAPKECGGPYHGNVAQDLREWIEAAGFEVTVTGGGRIDYHPSINRCVVYGFSYGFGKGNHEQAAALIRQHTDILATFDNTDGLY